MTTCAGYQDLWQIRPSTRKWCIFWQEDALTASAASSDVFAVRHTQNELTTEPVGARWLEKVMWNWHVQILSGWRDISTYWCWVLFIWKWRQEYFFVLQVLLLDKNIDVRISQAREIPLRCAKIANFGKSRVPADQSHGPASDMQPNFGLRVAFMSR
jgi:hypothetical protein